MCLLHKLGCLHALWHIQNICWWLCDLFKAWLPALWPIRKLCCWLCYPFKSLAACVVNYQKALLPALLRIQKLGCLLWDLSKSLAASCVTYSKALLPALLRIQKLGCLWCWAVERSVSNLDTSCSPQQRWEDISLSLQRKDHHNDKPFFPQHFQHILFKYWYRIEVPICSKAPHLYLHWSLYWYCIFYKAFQTQKRKVTHTNIVTVGYFLF